MTNSFTVWELIQNRLEYKIKAEVKAKAESLNTPERIELTFNGEPDFYFEPIGRIRR